MERQEVIDLDKIERLIQEAVSDSFRETYHHLLESESEEEIQKSTSKEIEDLKLRASKKKEGEKDLEEEETENPAQKRIVPKEKKEKTSLGQEELPEVIKSSDIVKVINIIRSGNSLKDKDVKNRFKQYFGTLSGAEKIALKGYLDGLAQVISDGVPGTQAVDPSDPPYNIEMKTDDKVNQDKTRTKKSSVEQIPSGEAAPIIVGEEADKSNILKYLKKINS